ncbi:MAG: FAD-binding monooxygenase, partial [Candidatus Eremiobacteraeota bacterium]|nr:FAD-binding monooxygenase [Candidatus Eremiobacteraeota bacterium]
MMRLGGREKRDRAIVIGGSIAGLLAARVLADRYRDVLLLERDPLDEAADRRGIPQGRHSHVLLASGSRVLESLFPGITEELVGSGATSGDVGQNVRWFFEGALFCRFESGIEGFVMSRSFLERIVRERVRRIANVRIRDATNVDSLS